MASKFFLCADNPVADRICSFCEGNTSDFSVAFRAESYESCIREAVGHELPILLFQLKHPVHKLHDSFYDLAVSRVSFILLLFEIAEENQIIYSISSYPDQKYIEKIKSFFTSALSVYTCHFNSIGDNENSNLVMKSRLKKLEKTEYLKDILRGAINSEFSYYKEKAPLNLKNFGYYLFVWDLMEIEYSDHYLNKNIYYLNGEEFVKECQDIVDEYEGGEVFYLEPTILCIIINSFHGASQAANDKMLLSLTNRLNYATDCKTAFRFMSGYIKDIRELREAYESFHFLRENHFFCSEAQILTPQYISSIRKTPDYRLIDATLQSIKDFIYHDIYNEQLIRSIKDLFLKVIKPSLDYNLYYYCSVVVATALYEKYSLVSQKDTVQTTGENRVFFSSIEKKCNELIDLIEKVKSGLSHKPSIANSIVIQAVEYIRKNYAEDLTVSTIASHLNISGSYLSLLFKNEMGTGIIKYIISVRMEKAKDLLSTSNLPVYNLSSQVGFTDSAHFSKTFKKIVGLTPLEYRKKNTKIGYIVQQIAYRN